MSGSWYGTQADRSTVVHKMLRVGVGRIPGKVKGVTTHSFILHFKASIQV